MNDFGDIDASRVLQSHGVRPRHRLGQNFLQDSGALEQITAAAEISPDDSVLEIGCGFGGLTRYLARQAANVVAIEVDSRLAEIAKDYLRLCRNVQLVCGDVLKLDLSRTGLPPGYITAANIPYYVTSPIMRHLLELNPQPRRIVLTVQEEVAERICAGPPQMGLLSLSVQVYGTTEIVGRIPARSFFPVPKVDSAVIRVEAYKSPRIGPSLIPVLFRIAKAGFLHRRKTLRNSISSGLGISLTEASSLLLTADIDPQRRAQTLSLDEWEALTRMAARQLS